MPIGEALGLMCQRVMGRLPAAERADYSDSSSRLSARGTTNLIRTCRRRYGRSKGCWAFLASRRGSRRRRLARILAQAADSIYDRAPSARLKGLILAAVWGTARLLAGSDAAAGAAGCQWRGWWGYAVSAGLALILAKRLGRGGGLLARLRELSMGFEAAMRW